ncbi:MAG: V-type ATP synthase subunit E [Treponema sp.]|nr:V-type ATP synthase subunit E [Treponema sp.]MCL2250652.1 V-type ATP synthase subunit E [Treponema sp.]
MEIQVQELIDKIKKDGIDTASRQASEIKNGAQAEAARIIEAAKKEADAIISNSKLEAERAERASLAALQQASRNLILAFKDEIQALLNKIVSENIGANYNGDILKSILPELIKNWSSKGSDTINLILPENQLNQLQAFFTDQLKKELGKGIELKSNRKLAYGFQISNKEGSAYYDFSSEAVAGLLSSYLNPKLAEIIKDSSKGM